MFLEYKIFKACTEDDDENCCLITYKEKYDAYTHYRVDKIEMIEDDRILSDKPFDLSTHSKTMFLLFSDYGPF